MSLQVGACAHFQAAMMSRNLLFYKRFIPPRERLLENSLD
jgi:hypothetical protein